MSNRTPHIQSSGTYFHIYNRGVNRNTIFFEEENYRFFLQRMNEYNIPELDILAYCLMPNHFHLIVQQHTPEAISHYMGRLCKSYVHAVNNRFNRTGHLFEGKYKIKEIDSIEYLLHLSRYIHLNPVRAQLVKGAKEWKYSSYEMYVNAMGRNSFLKPLTVLQEFNERNNYVDFVEMYKPADKEKIVSVLF